MLLSVIMPLSLGIKRIFAFLYSVTLWCWCSPHLLQKVRQVLGMFTMFVRALLAWKKQNSLTLERAVICRLHDLFVVLKHLKVSYDHLQGAECGVYSCPLFPR